MYFNSYFYLIHLIFTFNWVLLCKLLCKYLHVPHLKPGKGQQSRPYSTHFIEWNEEIGSQKLNSAPELHNHALSDSFPGNLTPGPALICLDLRHLLQTFQWKSPSPDCHSTPRSPLHVKWRPVSNLPWSKNVSSSPKFHVSIN